MPRSSPPSAVHSACCESPPYEHHPQYGKIRGAPTDKPFFPHNSKKLWCTWYDQIFLAENVPRQITKPSSFVATMTLANRMKHFIQNRHSNGIYSASHSKMRSEICRMRIQCYIRPFIQNLLMPPAQFDGVEKTIAAQDRANPSPVVVMRTATQRWPYCCSWIPMLGSQTRALFLFASSLNNYR